MADYRHHPDDSPFVWCIECRALTPKTLSTMVMRTIFRVESHGVYPYGRCTAHCAEPSLQLNGLQTELNGLQTDMNAEKGKHCIE
jgi:hypothetical protein